MEPKNESGFTNIRFKSGEEIGPPPFMYNYDDSDDEDSVDENYNQKYDLCRWVRERRNKNKSGEQETDEKDMKGNASCNAKNLNENNEAPTALPARKTSLYRATSDIRMSRTGKDKLIGYENTYRMEPKPNCYFIWYKARDAIQKLVLPLFQEFHYDPKTAPGFCKLLCNKTMITMRKKLDYPRYKYVCNVNMAQLNDQGIIIGDRALWNTTTDNVATVLIHRKDCVCVITLHAFYAE